MRAVFSIIKKSLPVASIYFGVFCVLMLLFNSAAVENDKKLYEGKSLNIVISSPDNSMLSKALGDVLGRENNVTYNLAEEVITDRVFNGMIDYAIYFPQGFDEAFDEDPENSRIETMSINASVSFLSQKTEQFFRYVRTGLATGKTLSEACDSAVKVCEVEAETAILGKTRSMYQIRGFYFLSYLAYILLSMMILLIGPVMQSFFQKDIRMRTGSSATPGQKLTLDIAAGTSVGAVGVFGFLMLMGLVLYHKDFTPKLFLFATVNAFVLLTVCFAISIVVGVLLHDKNALNGASNLIGMGMCFLGGVFVRVDLLPEYVRRIGQFLPVSWYIKNVHLLFSSNWEEKMGEYLKNLGIIASFAVACFCVALVAARKRRIV